MRRRYAFTTELVVVLGDPSHEDEHDARSLGHELASYADSLARDFPWAVDIHHTVSVDRVEEE